MCLVCLEYGYGKLTGDEALHNIREMTPIVGEEHAQKVISYIMDKEMDEIINELNLKIELWPSK